MSTKTVLRSKTAAPTGDSGNPMRRAKLRAIWLLLTPFVVLYMFAYVLPLLYAMLESFFRERRSGLGIGGGERSFVAFSNYVEAIQMPEFRDGIGRVLLLGAVQVPIMLGMALLLALAVDALADRYAGFARFCAFLPYAVPGVIAAILWAFLYLGGTSPFVQWFAAAGIHVDFLSPKMVLWSMANIITWTWTGYNMIIIYSSLKSIPTELYEAAAIDGAGPIQIAWRIKIPLVAPALILTGIFSIIGTVQLYSEPMILRPFTAAINASYTPNMAVQNVAFALNDYGLAAAMAVLLALGTALLTFAFSKISGGMTSKKVKA